LEPLHQSLKTKMQELETKFETLRRLVRDRYAT
jgi:hypothetical protein